MICSGSLITPTYFLSAAHCNNILIAENKDKVSQQGWETILTSFPQIDEYRERCAQATQRGEEYKVKILS